MRLPKQTDGKYRPSYKLNQKAACVCENSDFRVRSGVYFWVHEHRNADKLPFAATQGDFWNRLLQNLAGVHNTRRIEGRLDTAHQVQRNILLEEGEFLAL